MVKNVLRDGKKSENCPDLEQKASFEHVENKLMHRSMHGAVRCHVDALGDKDAAHRYAKHSGKVLEASYSNRTWCANIAMAKVVGHRGGAIQLYSAGTKCSTEKETAFKGLFDRNTLVSDQQLTAAKRLLEGCDRWPGMRATLMAVRTYDDIILQD